MQHERAFLDARERGGRPERKAKGEGKGGRTRLRGRRRAEWPAEARRRRMGGSGGWRYCCCLFLGDLGGKWWIGGARGSADPT